MAGAFEMRENAEADKRDALAMVAAEKFRAWGFTPLDRALFALAEGDCAMRTQHVRHGLNGSEKV